METQNVNVTGQRKLAFLWSAALSAALLTACSGPSTPPAGGDEPGSGVQALVLGDVSSPIYDQFKADGVRMVRYDNSQNVADYKLVVFDGDTLTPAAVRANEVIHQALRAHKWVLAVDATADHKRTGLGDDLLAATKGTSPGYLARITQERGGHAGTQVLEYPGAPTPGGAFATTAQPPSANRGVTAEGAAQFARNALRQLKSGRVQPLQSNSGPDIPSYVSYYPFYFTMTYPWTAGGAQKHNQNGTQSVYYQMNYAFNVFLDNATNPLGDFQWVSAQIDGEANPTAGTGTFVNRADDEQAWFQDQLLFSVTPSAGSSSQFTSFGNSSPATQNNQTTVTSGVSFTVGLSKDGPSSSFGYSYSQERDITDWKITNDSSGNLMSWNYRSNNPYNADSSYQCGDAFQSNNGFDNWDCYPETPNDLSLNTLSTDAQGVWNTQASGVVSGWVDFDAHSEQHVADAYCSSDFIHTCIEADKTGSSRGYVYYDNILSINMSAVIPILISSLTFSENPATAGDTVTGTVTLTSAAQRDTTVLLSSNIGNATVLPSVTIPQGQTSATFQVLTNANGLSSGASTVATITAFYAQNYQAQLTVKAP